MDRKEYPGYFIGEDTGPGENVDILKATENDMTSSLGCGHCHHNHLWRCSLPSYRSDKQRKKSTHLSSKESAHSNDTQDVEHSRAHNRSYTDISMGDEHTWNKKEMMAEPDRVEPWKPVPSMHLSN